VVVAPLPEGVHRIVATVDEAPEWPGAADVQGLLDNRGPARDRAIVETVLWGSRFRVHHRLAERYQLGRIFLAGDAAHVHSPAGGQGMNTGIQDAIALAGVLAAAVEGNAPEGLEHYSAQRRPVAESVVSLANRLTRAATVKGTFRPFRNAVLRLLSHSAPFRHNLAMRLAGLA
jgi:2-polyprenyl-6-methoxyphenol hydroxylase-like FAD-dependent oxidoreductase